VASSGFTRNIAASPAVPLVFEDDFDFDDNSNGSMLKGSYSSVESTKAAASKSNLLPAPVAQAATRAVSKAPAVAPVVVFEEPNVVLNIRDLAIDPHVAALKGDASLAKERYRALSVKLLNLADRRKMKTLLVTSAQADDGKTTIATGLAWSLAKGAERRVLLIDASQTLSAAGRMLGIEPKRGWLNMLDGSSVLKQALIRFDPNGLYLLSAGTTSAPLSSDVCPPRLETMIAQLAPQFDLVIVDSGSILDSLEAQRLASALDGVVIVARANHTRQSEIAAARKLVPKERRLGVVLNDSGLDTVSNTRAGRWNGFVASLFRRRS
jgi:capsular exopolysaccharide synthesis family protein